MTPDFLLTALVVVLLPGTGVIYTVSTGLARGARASVAAAAGCTLGIVPHLVASALGLAALLHASAVAFQLAKIAPFSRSSCRRVRRTPSDGSCC